MEFFGTVVLAWLWLDAGRKALSAEKGSDAGYAPGFYAGKVHAMKYYFHYELPKTTALAEVLMHGEATTLEPPSELFG
jgi:butyryl-CoA dehydrogenase